MPKHYAAVGIVTALLACALAGCSAMLETSEYRVVAPHEETSNVPVSADSVINASNYDELKSALIRMIRSGAESGTVRLRNYAGRVDGDVRAAVREVSKEEPVGAWAIDLITYELTPLLGDYIADFSLTFRRAKEEIRAVENLNGPTAFRERVERLLAEYGETLTVETNYYIESGYNAEAILLAAYDANPVAAQGFPEISMSVYPETGFRRVAELTLKYPFTARQMTARTEFCARAAGQIARGIGEEDAPRTALALYDYLAENTSFDTARREAEEAGEDVNATVYDIFARKLGLPESYALAYAALCAEVGIECLVVRGRRGVNEHAWNLVKPDGNWYHCDLAADKMLNGDVTHEFFLMSDEDVSADYKWDVNAMPPAAGTLTYGEIIGGEQPEPPEEPADEPSPEEVTEGVWEDFDGND